MYHIKFENTNLYLTVKTIGFIGEGLFGDIDPTVNQKFVLKRNVNNSYTIFDTGLSSLNCSVIGSPIDNPPLNSMLKYNFVYGPNDIFQQFYFIKLQ